MSFIMIVYVVYILVYGAAHGLFETTLSDMLQPPLVLKFETQKR